MIIVGFFLTRILVNQLGLEVFGLFTTIGASGMFFALVTNTMQLSVAREFGIRIGEGDSKRLASAFLSAFFIQLACGLIMLMTGLICSRWILERLIVPEGYLETTSICLTLIFLQITAGIVASPFGGLIRAHQDISTVSALQLAGRVAVFLSALCLSLIHI